MPTRRQSGLRAPRRRPRKARPATRTGRCRRRAPRYRAPDSPSDGTRRPWPRRGRPATRGRGGSRTCPSDTRRATRSPRSRASVGEARASTGGTCHWSRGRPSQARQRSNDRLPMQTSASRTASPHRGAQRREEGLRHGNHVFAEVPPEVAAHVVRDRDLHAVVLLQVSSGNRGIAHAFPAESTEPTSPKPTPALGNILVQLQEDRRPVGRRGGTPQSPS